MKGFMFVFVALFISAQAALTPEDRENIKTYLTTLANGMRLERQKVTADFTSAINAQRDGTSCVEAACDQYLAIGKKNIDSSLGELIELFEDQAEDAHSEEEFTLEVAKTNIDNGKIAQQAEIMKKAINVELGLNLKKLTSRIQYCRS